jgi:hypothetical protein
MEKLIRTFSYLDPIFLYYSLIYGIVKVFEIIFRTGSVWQMCWDIVREKIGDNDELYILCGLNIYTIILYWGFGLTLVFMERTKTPKNFHSYKIQGNENVAQNNDDLIKVSKPSAWKSLIWLSD